MKRFLYSLTALFLSVLLVQTNACATAVTASRANDGNDLTAGAAFDNAGAWVLTVADGSNFTTGAVTTAGAGGATAGTLTFAGDSTVTTNVATVGNPLLAINAGAAAKTVTLNGNAFATTTNLTSSGALALNGNLTGNLNYSTGGTGTVTLAAAKTLTGIVTNTTTNQGTLALTGGSAVTGAVGSTGVGLNTISLTGGNATIGGNTLASNFVLGGDTLAITGTVGAPVAGSINTTATSGTTFGRMTSTGIATVAAGATSAVTVNGFITNGSSLTIIDGTGGLAIGALSAITSTSPNITFTQGASTSDLVLVASRNTAPATTSNNRAIATTINGIAAPTGDMLVALGALDSLTTATQVDSALSQLDPVVNGGTAQTNFNIGSMHFDALTGHLADARSEMNSGSQSGLSTGDAWRETGMWVKGFGNHAEQDVRGGINGYDADTWGVTGGLDGLVSEGTRLGFAGGYAASDVSNQGEAGGSDIDAYQGTIYMGFDAKPWYLNTAFSFAWNTYDSTRNISFGSINRVADSSTDGQQYSVILDSGYVIPVNQWEITPLMSLEYSHLNINGYTETGAGSLNLVVDDQSYDFLQMGLGGKFARPILTDSGSWVPEMHARWLYDFIGDKAQTTSTFTGGGAAFATNGLEPAQGALNAGTGIAFYSKGNVTISAVYDLVYKEDFTSHNVEGVFRYNF